MIAFVILQYGGIKDTIRCIESILINLQNEDFKIIVVDNNSNDSSGEILKNKYEKNIFVNVILNKLNSGFSAGNNIGCQYAIKEFEPDFLCVLNNDTYIDDKNFVKKINEIYDSNNFDALGPKIWNIHRKYNQNPFKVISTIEEVETELKKKELAEKILNSQLPYLYYLFSMINKKNTVRQEGLHGAALIFSSKYFKKFKTVFPEMAFLYNEENFLNYRKIKNDLKFVYNPSIVVYHNHSSSTRKITNGTVNKWKFHHKHSRTSLKKLYEVFLEQKNI